MKQFRLLSMLFGAAMLFSLTSCGGTEEKTTTDSTATTTDTTVAATPAPAESTIVTTPENFMLVRHKVADFTKWKASYDAHDSMRLANGIHSYVIGRGVQDTNMVMVAVKTEDIAKAKAFAKDPSLKAAMQKGGVTGTPSFRFTTVVYQDGSKNMSDLRSMTTFSVKDWDTWRKGFESHRQTRIENGLTDRAYGYETDDNHKVVLVVAINDTAKASAFWKSDLLKQQRAESGVIGEPERFIYRVVQKY